MNYFSLPTVCVGKLENVSLDFYAVLCENLIIPNSIHVDVDDIITTTG